ncbi:MAG: hypothetical protein KC441_01640 [Anaerolineales bacterium]|nr:hypothetical protein [Anaerolineales bacterium]
MSSEILLVVLSVFLTGVFTLINTYITIRYEHRLRQMESESRLEPIEIRPGKFIWLKLCGFPINDKYDAVIGLKEDRNDCVRIDSIAVQAKCFERQFPIPPQYRYEPNLEIRIEKKNKKGAPVIIDSIRFDNINPLPLPILLILDAVRDESVIIRYHGFPVLEPLSVYFGPMGTKGEGGVKAAHFTPSENNGVLTLSIPPQLLGSYQIAVRIENSQGYFAYNWFYNNDYDSSGNHSQ